MKTDDLLRVVEVTPHRILVELDSGGPVTGKLFQITGHADEPYPPYLKVEELKPKEVK